MRERRERASQKAQTTPNSLPLHPKQALHVARHSQASQDPQHKPFRQPQRTHKQGPTHHTHKTSHKNTQPQSQNLSIAPLGDPSSAIRCRFGLGGEPFPLVGEPFPLVGETRGDAGMAALVSSSFRTSYRCARGVVGRQRQFTHETSFSIVAVGSIANEKTMKVIAMSASAYGKRRPVGD